MGATSKTELEMLEELKQYDTPTITNVVATYPNDHAHCLGLYHPWRGNWYTDQTLKCMYPELGRMAGYVVTVTFGIPDPAFARRSMLDLYKVIEAAPKPVILAVKQAMPDAYKRKNGLLGGNMMTAFRSLGVIGVVSDGPSRDLDEVRGLGVQYMLTGVCAGHGDFGIMEINTPVSICGMDVAPGEIIHMDENGAVKFPREYLPEVAERCKKLNEHEIRKQSLLAQFHDAKTLAEVISDNYK